MMTRLVLKAVFKFSNILWLAAGFLGSYLIIPQTGFGGDATLAALISAACIYAASIIYTLSSKKFHEDFNRKQKISRIRQLDRECQKLGYEARRVLNQAHYQKLKKVMESKNEIVSSFFRGESSYLKERIVEQTLNLVASYIKLLINYSKRTRELNQTDLSEVVNRINLNIRKLSFAKDLHAAEDIKKVIEMDENIVKGLKEEKIELERINAKLEYMESTVSMFKHQVLSSIESQDMLDKLEAAVNEASALDSVLQERRRNRARY
ncbi:MAG: hypothetical protein N2489_02565 [Clostridia bacterium]|nr:hypothetical protein [Clostridia bacterium]